MPAVPAAPREDRHEPDEDGAKSEVIADKEPCKAFNARALQSRQGKIALSPTYLKYLNLYLRSVHATSTTAHRLAAWALASALWQPSGRWENVNGE